MTPVTVSPAARADIVAGFRWYENQRPGLGRDFLNEIRTAFSRVAEAPQAYAQVYRNVRRVSVRRFPYGLFFRVRDPYIQIVACMHGKRDPREWKSRV